MTDFFLIDAPFIKIVMAIMLLFELGVGFWAGYALGSRK